TRTPLPPTAPASDSSRTLARPSGCDHCAAAPQSSIPALRENVSGSSLASQAALPRTAALLLLATVFSSSKKVLHASCAYGKTRPRSAHFLFALQSGCATSLAFQVGSCQKLAASDARRQDGVQISLTQLLLEVFLSFLAAVRRYVLKEPILGWLGSTSKLVLAYRGLPRLTSPHASKLWMGPINSVN